LHGLKGYEVTGRDLAHLDKGHTFGELALITESPRMASIVTITNTALLVLMKDDFDDCLADINVKSAEDKVELLDSSRCCRDLSTLEIKSFQGDWMLKHFSVGEFLLMDKLDKLFVVGHGAVQLCSFKPKLFSDEAVKANFERAGFPSLKEGVHFETVCTIHKGEIIGETSIFPELKRNFVLRVTSSLECLWLPSDKFDEVVTPAMRDRIFQEGQARVDLHEKRSIWNDKDIAERKSREIVVTRHSPRNSPSPLRF